MKDKDAAIKVVSENENEWRVRIGNCLIIEVVGTGIEAKSDAHLYLTHNVILQLALLPQWKRLLLRLIFRRVWKHLLKQ